MTSWTPWGCITYWIGPLWFLSVNQTHKSVERRNITNHDDRHQRHLTPYCRMENHSAKWLFHDTGQETIEHIVNSGYLSLQWVTCGQWCLLCAECWIQSDYTEPKNDVLTTQSHRTILLDKIIVRQWVKTTHLSFVCCHLHECIMCWR